MTNKLITPQEIANDLGISKPTYYRRFKLIPKDGIGVKVGHYWSPKQANIIKHRILNLGLLQNTSNCIN